MKVSLFFLCSVLFTTSTVLAIGQERYVEGAPSPGSFALVQGDNAATLYVDANDFAGVIRAAKDLQADIARVTGRNLDLVQNENKVSETSVIIGTIGKSPIIDRLIRDGKLDARNVAGNWESFIVQVIPNALPNVSNALIIAGSDKRGTIYGIYDLSEQIGVSPWYWWADVPARHQNALFVKSGRYVQGEPSVKYRGIFLNDESPDLTNWVREKFGTVPNLQGVANYNKEFYSRIFEVILRLKGNYLWPAMWNNAFYEDDPENPKLADEYGIVMGTSHQEPMLRAQKEWDRRFQRTLGSWNYHKNPDELQNFWREGIKRNKNYESIITMGLRGANDTPMIPNGTVQQSMDLLKQIIDVQRKMIAEEVNPDVTKVPQLWCPYKEVLDYYNAGFRIPDDVTILWTDDNWGNIRRLPTEAERKRPGGAGIYYHFDYVGGPRNYKWINTNPISKVWEQMSAAKEYGADRIWIVNVGHFKGLEFPIEYFMHLGWNTKLWTHDNINAYTWAWAAREFGQPYDKQIAEIISKYAKYNGRRKPELLEPTTYSLTNYQEAETVAADFRALATQAEAIHEKLPENVRDAFYELVLFPTLACAQVNEMYVAAGKNALYAQQGRASTNDMADEVERLFKADSDLMDRFNHTLAGGKWNHFMDQAHIGYTNWQDPPRNVMPRVRRTEVPATPAIGVAVEGSALAWPGADGQPALPRFDSFNHQRRSIEVFNRGQGRLEFTTTASEPWIVMSSPQDKLARVGISIDWDKAPKGLASGTVKVSGTGQDVLVKVEAFNPVGITRESLDGFVEGDGYVSIEAEHFTKSIPASSTRWEKIDDYGRTLSAMTILPITAASVTPPQGSTCLEYKMYTFTTGPANVQAIVAPTLNHVPGRGVRYAVSFDDQPPQVITVVSADFNAQNGNREWENSVRDNARISRSSHVLSNPGYHTLKIGMVDPGVVLEKLVVDLGGVRPSYLGPPESYHHVN